MSFLAYFGLYAKGFFLLNVKQLDFEQCPMFEAGHTHY